MFFKKARITRISRGSFIREIGVVRASFVRLPLLPLHLEARALLCPFHGFHLAVAVEVGAQVAMSHHLGAGIVQQQRPDEDAERMALPLGASVFGHAVVVQTALITDAY